MPYIKDKDTEAPTEEVIKVEPDHQEAVVEATTEATEEVSDETAILAKPEGTTTKTTILKNPEINRHLLLTEEAPMEAKMVEEEQTLQDSKARQKSGV